MWCLFAFNHKDEVLLNLLCNRLMVNLKDRSDLGETDVANCLQCLGHFRVLNPVVLKKLLKESIRTCDKMNN